MKNAIIFITVSFLAVDFSVSIKCYQCDRNNNKKTCRSPESTECKNGNFCVIEMKQKGVRNYSLGCAGPQNSYECDKNSHLCNFCQYDHCNEYPHHPYLKQPKQCYELYWEDGSQSFTPTIFQIMSKNLKRTFCPHNQNCIEATDNDKKFYYGCEIFKSNECQKYNFTDCRECDSDLCNTPKEYNIKLPLVCFECLKWEHKDVFEGISDCDNPKTVVCGNSEKCVRALGEDDWRFHGCYRDDKDTLRKEFGFTNITFCSKNFCNKIEEDPPPPKCYECYEGDDKNFKSKPVCPYSSEIQCKPGFKCVEASSKNGAIRYHGCADEEKFCNQSDFQVCEYCNGNLCNYVKKLECYKCYTAGLDSDFRPKSKPKWLIDEGFCDSKTRTSRCEHNETCVSAYNTDGTRYHGCLLKTDNPNAECSKLGFSHCSVCSQDACNPVNQTEGKKGKHSSALTLTNNRLLIILLFFVLLFSA